MFLVEGARRLCCGRGALMRARSAASQSGTATGSVLRNLKGAEVDLDHSEKSSNFADV